MIGRSLTKQCFDHLKNATVAILTVWTHVACAEPISDPPGERRHPWRSRDSHDRRGAMVRLVGTVSRLLLTVCRGDRELPQAFVGG